MSNVKGEESMELTKDCNRTTTNKNKNERHKWYHINTSILPAKCSYFFECARRIGYSPNLILFLTSIGLTKLEAGFIVGFRLIGQFLGAPFWGMISDKWHCHRIVIIIMNLAALLTMASQPFISIQYGDPEPNKCPLVSPTIAHYQSPNGTNCNSTLSCHNNWTSIETQQPVNYVEDKIQFGTLFWVMFFINFAVCFCEGSAVAFIDTATVRKIQLSKHRNIHYGKQRMFASIGGAFGITITNLAIEYFPKADVTCYSGVFATFAIFSIIYAGFVLVLYRGVSFHEVSKDSVTKDDEDKMVFRKILFKTLRRWDMVFFYLTAFISGLEYSQHVSFILFYLKEMNSPTIVLTMAIVVSNFGALFGFFFADRIVELVGGIWKTCVLTCVAFFVRYFITGMTTNPWVIVACQSAHGVTTTLLVAAGILHLKNTSPIPVITTLMSLFNTVHYGLGTIVGSSIGGIIYQNYGGRSLYVGTAVLAIVWALVLIVYITIEKKKTKDSKSGLEKVEDDEKLMTAL